MESSNIGDEETIFKCAADTTGNSLVDTTIQSQPKKEENSALSLKHNEECISIFHPKYFENEKWTCCQNDKMHTGCKFAIKVNCESGHYYEIRNVEVSEGSVFQYHPGIKYYQFNEYNHA
jgi:hypothetical protein